MYEVIGTKGVLTMDPAYEMVGDLRSEITIEGKTRKMKFPQRDQFGPEIVYFSKCILENRQPEPGGKEGLADVRIILHAVLESQKSGKPVKLEPVDITTRPSAELEIHKPPVPKVPLVKAAPPSL